MNIIEIKNLNFSYKDKVIFEHLNLDIKKNSFLTILGANSSGKSTLAKLIVTHNKNIILHDKSIGYVISNPDYQIIGNTVKEQLMFYLKEQNLTSSQINFRVSKIVKEFSLKSIIDKDPYHLSNEQKQIIVLLAILISDFKIIILDDALSMISSKNKEMLFNYMKKKKRTIVNITNDPEESIYSDNIAILNKNIVINESVNAVLKKEKVFLDNNLIMPFMAELSIKLKYYNLVDDIILDMGEMVDKIWN